MYKRPYSTSVLSSGDSSSSTITENSDNDFELGIFSHHQQQQQDKLSTIRSSSSLSTPSHHKTTNISPKNGEFSLEDLGLSEAILYNRTEASLTPSNCAQQHKVLATKEGSMRRANSNNSKVRRKRVHDIHTPTHVDFEEVKFDDRPHTSLASIPQPLKTRSSADVSVQIPSNLFIPQHRQYSSFRNTPMSLSPTGEDANPWISPLHVHTTEQSVELPKLKISKSRSSLNITEALKFDEAPSLDTTEGTPRLEPLSMSTRSSRANIDFVIDISTEEVRRDVLPSPVVNQNMREKFSSERTKTDNFYNDVHVSKKEKVDHNSIFFYSLKKVLSKTCSLVLKPTECIEFVECKGLGSVYLVPESEKPKRASPVSEKKKSKKVNLPLLDDLSDDEIGRFLMESDEEEDASNYKALVLYDSWEGIDLCTKSLTEEVDDRVTIFGNENEINEYHIIIRGDVKVYYRNRYDLAVKNK
ncbi:predicted protein [Naegleria gruberi]|uniref:Predicted protein n=1 Tax=Naegleria gruberi TaxID=5762 RepID=D2W3I2_NAEGR|nr:uncharacterized protein NAEGRDRAFT_75952 [Naegleria gruberi]EFC36428.1 predicted protein [Naegleria gruberi]|eukprot:XP_002669172.1 predicted protein [Naegleria gruberi strain NEG-M]